MDQKQTLFQSLDNAIENGYEFDLHTSLQIAEDLHEYDASFEGANPLDLVHLVEEWQNSRRDKLGARVGFCSNIILKK